MPGADDTPLRASPDHPGWQEWHVPGAFNREVVGLLLVRDEGGGTARVRMFPGEGAGNAHGFVHGGIISAFADAALFAGPGVLSESARGGAVTIELSVQFTGAASLGEPLDALVTVVRETGRMIFAQGRIVQGEGSVAGFSGIVRKITT